jgi:hypothetical protein
VVFVGPIGEKFVIAEDAWHNETLEQEFNIAAEKQLKQSAGGRTGGQRSGAVPRQESPDWVQVTRRLPSTLPAWSR